MHTLFTPCYFAAIVFSPLQKCISVLGLHLIFISVLCFLWIIRRSSCASLAFVAARSRPAIAAPSKPLPASFQPRFILFLNSGNAEQGDGLIKNQRIGSIFLVKQDRFSFLGKLHSLHKWFSFAMRMKVWSLRSSPKPPLGSHQPD